MDALDKAGHTIIHEYPGGAPKLALALNMNAGTLNNKADPAMPGHQFKVREAIAIQVATQRFDFLYAEAQMLGHVAVQIGHFSNISDVALLDAYAKYHQEIGETAAEIRKALEAGRVTKAQYQEIEREAFEDATAMFDLLARLKGLVDDE